MWEVLGAFSTFLPAILSGDTEARHECERTISELIKDVEPLKEYLSNAGFCNGQFVEHIDWSKFAPELGKARNIIQRSIDEMKLLPSPKRKRGRPVGSTNKKKDTDETHEEAVEQDEKPQKKPRNTKKKGPVEEDCPPEEPEDSEPVEEENTKNKCGSIPLKRKCEIVEHALRLREAETVHHLEKEIMSLYKKEFYSPETGKWKSGLLYKWIRSETYESWVGGDSGRPIKKRLLQIYIYINIYIYVGTPTKKTTSIWKILEFFYLKKSAEWPHGCGLAMDGKWLGIHHGKSTGDLKITQAYICIYREKGKPSSKPPFLGAMLIFQGVETPEAESYLLYLYIYVFLFKYIYIYMLGRTSKKHLLFGKPSNSSIWKNRPNGHMDEDSNGWKVIRYTPWKINRGPKNHPNVYVYTKKRENHLPNLHFWVRCPFSRVFKLQKLKAILGPPPEKHLLFEKSSNSSIWKKGQMATWVRIAMDGKWLGIHHGKSTGDLKITQMYMYIQRKGKTIFQTSICGCHVHFPGCSNSRSWKLCWDPHQKNIFYLKNHRILLFEKKTGQMATWVRMAMDGT